MSTTVQPWLWLHPALVEPPEQRNVVRVLAFGVGMMDDQAEAGAGARGGLPEHLAVAVGIAERGDGPAADELAIPTGLPAPSSTKSDFGQPHQHRLAVAQLVLQLELLPATCSGGMPYTCSARRA